MSIKNSKWQILSQALDFLRPILKINVSIFLFFVHISARFLKKLSFRFQMKPRYLLDCKKLPGVYVTQYAHLLSFCYICLHKVPLWNGMLLTKKSKIWVCNRQIWFTFLEKNLKTTDRECVYSILSQNYIFCICLGGGRDSSAATIIMHE